MSAPDLLRPAVPTIVVSESGGGDALGEVGDAAAVLALSVTAQGLGRGRDVDDLLRAVGLERRAVLAGYEPSAQAGSITTVTLPAGQPSPARTLLLAGVGDSSPDALRTAGAGLARAVKGRSTLVVWMPAARSAAGIQALVEGLVFGGYTVPRWSSAPTPASTMPVGRIVLAGRHDQAAVDRAAISARAAMIARNLANTPSNVKSPQWLAEQSRSMAGRAGLRVAVRGEKELARDGFGGLLAVGGGSACPPRLVEMSYRPESARQTPHIVLVGKGITFDSGGLDLKTPEAMRTMKTDMSGAGTVLAVLSVCRELAIPVRVTGLLALAENAVSGSSYRPGDVVTQYGGTTVEIGNTDAEGRIVLADALAYADAELEPDVLIDIATLTASARMALGRGMAAGYATDVRLEKAVRVAGEQAGEPVWPMPLFQDYRSALDSDVADLNHVVVPNAAGFGAGSIVAALFLREFVGQRRWAHLDIAGPGRSERDDGILTKGATGFGTRLLLRYLASLG